MWSRAKVLNFQPGQHYAFPGLRRSRNRKAVGAALAAQSFHVQMVQSLSIKPDVR
jgi:hypothetical protein